MTGLEFIAALVDSLAWPSALVVLLVFLRPHLGQLLGLIRTVKFKELEMTFGEAAPQAADALERFWMPDGHTPNAENEARLRAWLDRNGLVDVSVTAFLNVGPFEDMRKRAIIDLGLEKLGNGDGGAGNR